MLSGKNKIKLLTGSIVIIVMVILAFRYVFVWTAPFVLAFVVAVLIEKPVRKLSRCLWNNKLLAAAVIMTALLLLLLLGIGYVGYFAFQEIRQFLAHYHVYMGEISASLMTICDGIDQSMGLECGCSFAVLMDNVDNIASHLRSTWLSAAMETSIPMLVQIVVWVGSFFILLISVVYLSRDLDKIRAWKRNSVFHEELEIFCVKLRQLGNVYFKVQGLIMVCTGVICTIGLLLIGNPYAVVIGILIGVLDALPLFGTGTVLIPWSIFALINKDFLPAAILFTVYIITYFVREIMESKLMGNKLSIAPVTMLAVIYMGLLLFGIFGFILGPVSYIIIKTAIEIMKSNVENTVKTW